MLIIILLLNQLPVYQMDHHLGVNCYGYILTFIGGAGSFYEQLRHKTPFR